MKNPTTDKHLNISLTSDTGFADVRQRALDEYIWRKSKRNKQTKKPSFKIGEKVVLTKTEKGFLLVEVLDFTVEDFGRETFYGIVLKSSKETTRIGRLIHFMDSKWLVFNWGYANVSPDSVKWR